MGSSDLELGLRFFRAGQLSEAAAACSRHLSSRPEDPTALHLLGRVLLKGGRLREAAATLERAAQAAPADAQVLLALGSARRGAGDAEGARVAFERATQLSPSLGPAWFNLGLALRDGGRTREAVLAFRQAARIDADDHDAVQNVVTTLEGAVLRGEQPFTPAPPAILPGKGVPVSIVVCSIEAERLRRFRERMAPHLEGREHEVIVIDDARSLCEGYRRGWERTRHPIVVFSHDDFHIFSDRPFDAIEAALAKADIVGLAGSTLAAGPWALWAGHPHIHGWITHPAPDGDGLETAVISLSSGIVGGMQTLDGVFLAMHREIAGRVGFDEETFDGFHFYDLDFTVRAARAGLRLAVTTDIVGIHESLGRFDAVYDRYAERFRAKYPDLATRPRGFTQWYGARFQAPGQVLAFCEQLRALAAITSPLDDARLHHQRGELSQAIAGYASVLEEDPARPDVWHQKGLAEQQAGRLDDALASVAQAIETGGERPPFLMLQGQLLHDRGELSQAQARFARLVAARPDWAPAHIALGSVHMDLGAFDAAAQAFRAAVETDPKHARAWQNLGVALQSLARFDEAGEAFERAVAIDPGYALAHLNLARVNDSRDAAKAFKHAETAARLDPRLVDAWLLAADIHRRRFEFDQSFQVLDACLARMPGDVRAMIARAELLAELGRVEEGRAEFAAIALRAPASLKAALGAHLLLPRVYESAEHLDRSRVEYSAGLEALHARAGDFRHARPEAALSDARWVNFYLAYQGGNDRPLQERYGALVRRVLEPQLGAYFARRPRRPRSDRIRVGFASHFFFNCVVGRYFASWITHLDRRRFDSFVYYTNEWIAEDTRKIAAASGTFRHLAGRALTAIADQVIADDLDILVYPELGMHPDTFALAQLRLAPVQCAGWGHPVTTGIPEIDWFISCEGMEPEGGEAHYRERLALLPGLGTRYEVPRPDAQGARADFGIPDDATAYFVPQSLFKIHPGNDALVAEVLARDPNGIAVLFPARQPRFNEVFSRRLEAAFAARGVDFASRTRFLKFVPHGTYLRINELCDVMLDTLHWSGGNTSLDALATGLPMVTLPGAFMRGRQSAAMLRDLGLDELIAADAGDYVAKAVAIGRDRERRKALSQRIVEARPRLFEREEPVRAFEEFLARAVGEAS